MTNEELNAAVYEKFTAEQKDYVEWLLAQPPKDIMNHSFETASREDIVMAIEDMPLTDDQCIALLKMQSPLAQVYKDYRDFDSTYYMEEIRDQIFGCADWEAEKLKKAASREAR